MILLPLKFIYKMNAFSEAHPEIVCSYYISKIRYAIDHNEPLAHLFKATDAAYVFGVKQEHYTHFLSALMDLLVKKELYELATECRNLIDKLTINTLIESSKYHD